MAGTSGLTGPALISRTERPLFAVIWSVMGAVVTPAMMACALHRDLTSAGIPFV